MFYGVLVVGLTVFYSAETKAQVTLEDAIKTTLNRNLQIKQAEFGFQLSEQDLYESKSALYPSLNANLSNTYNFGLAFDQTYGELVRGNKWINSAGGQISSSVAVFQGFQKINQIRANKIQLTVDQSEIEKVKNDLTLSVITNYLEAITNGELYAASQQQVKLSSEQLRLDSIQFEVGNKTLADIAQAENQVATDELNVMTSQNAYELALLALKQLMEMSPDTVITLENPNVDDFLSDGVPSKYQDIYQQALKTQPDIAIARKRSDLAAQQIKIAQGGYYPTVTVSANYGTNYSSLGTDILTREPLPFGNQLDQNKSFNGGVTLNVPIFNNNRTKVAVSKAKINLLQAENNQALAKRNLEKTISQALLDVKTSGKQYVASQTAFASSKVAFGVIKERYDVGMANAMELFTAQTNMNKAEFDTIRAKYIMVFRTKVIDYYIGNPIKFNNTTK